MTAYQNACHALGRMGQWLLVLGYVGRDRFFYLLLWALLWLALWEVYYSVVFIPWGLARILVSWGGGFMSLPT
jgi:hypothetical protein